jgi:hypothetical protein
MVASTAETCGPRRVRPFTFGVRRYSSCRDLNKFRVSFTRKTLSVMLHYFGKAKERDSRNFSAPVSRCHWLIGRSETRPSEQV